MDRNATLTHVRSWNIDDRVWLVRAVLDSITEDGETAGPSDAQKDELDRRIADMEANPDDEVPWEQVYAESMRRVRQ
ncbi:MAG TPA: addiction module protein [Gemmataceae bacterium]|nr:addiction module protein [Gemmataceae bacterium]